MPLLHLPSLYQTLILPTILYLLYTLHYHLTTGASRRKLIRTHNCKPAPKFRQYDILGLMTMRNQMRIHKARTFLASMHSQFENLGVNTWRLRVLGQEFTITREPENLKVMQAVEFQKWSIGTARKKEFHYLLGTGIFTSDGKDWMHSRDMLRPNFVRSQVGDVDMFERHVGHLIAAIPRDGTTVDLQTLFFKLTMDSATEFLFGESTGCLEMGKGQEERERAERFALAFSRAQERMEKEEWAGSLAWLFRKKQYKEDCKFVHDFVDAFITKATTTTTNKPPGDRYTFLSELLSRTSSPIRIRSELLNILLAGRDTTASLLSNVFHTLARNPSIQAALRHEISSTLNGSAPTFAELKELKYLRAVLNESLRLYPVVPMNSREAVVDTVLPLGGGEDGNSPLFVRKGAVVGWSSYSMHRREDFYGDDAEEFRPERWLGEKGLRPTWEYLPFNGGARICLGQQYALTEASYTTVRLLQEFDRLESRDPEPWRECLSLTCTGFGGCQVALFPAEGAGESA